MGKGKRVLGIKSQSGGRTRKRVEREKRSGNITLEKKMEEWRAWKR